MHRSYLLGFLGVLAFIGTAAVQASGFDYRYVVRQGDLNADGLVDFYFEHRPAMALVPLDDISIPIPTSKSVLKSFALLRQAGGGYTLNSNLTPAQRSQVQSWSIARASFTNDDFNGDGQRDLFVGGLPSGSNPASFEDAVILAPSTTAPAQAVGALIAQTYYVRAGDINNDGLVDLLVTGNSKRFVSDFILQRVSWSCSTCKRFDVVQNPTSAQLQIAATWPVTKIDVYRQDLNFDGYFDFYIEGIGKVIPDAEDLIVYTKRNVGRTAVKAVKLDPYFYNVAHRIEDLLYAGNQGLADFYKETCYTTNMGVGQPLPSVPYDWLYNGAPDNWYRNLYIDYYGNIPFTNGYVTTSQTCIVHGYSLGPHVQRFVRSSGDWLGMGIDCADCALHAETQLAVVPGWLVLAQVLSRAAAVEDAALILGGMIIAERDVDVGTADDVTLQTIVVLYGANNVLKIVAEASQNPDAGPQQPASPQQPTSPGDASTPGDPFQIPGGFDPNDPNQDKPGNTAGDSERLGKNLQRAGWPKPHPDAAAHHIVQGGSQDPAAISARIAAGLRNRYRRGGERRMAAQG